MKVLATVMLLGAFLFQSPCATVTLALGSATVSQGGTQTIQSTVTNCGTKKIRLGVTVTVTDAVGHISLIRNTIQQYNPSEVVVFNDIYAVPSDSPLGNNRVMTLVFDNSQGGSTEIARAEQTFDVVP